MKLNGKELTNKEELKLHKREALRLRNIVKTHDYRDGANALDRIRYENEMIFKLNAKIRIAELTEKLYKTRNNKEYDLIENKINKLRVVI